MQFVVLLCLVADSVDAIALVLLPCVAVYTAFLCICCCKLLGWCRHAALVRGCCCLSCFYCCCCCCCCPPCCPCCLLMLLPLLLLPLLLLPLMLLLPFLLLQFFYICYSSALFFLLEQPTTYDIRRLTSAAKLSKTTERLKFDLSMFFGRKPHPSLTWAQSTSMIRCADGEKSTMKTVDEFFYEFITSANLGCCS